MAFVVVDTDFANIIEEGAKRKMNLGGDARIGIGNADAVGPVVYYLETKDAVPGSILKIWNSHIADQSKYEFVENVLTAQVDAEAWLTGAGGDVTAMLTHAPA